MVPRAEVALPSTEIRHFVGEFVKAPLKLSIVRWCGNAPKRRRGDGFDYAVCTEGCSVQLNLGHTRQGRLGRWMVANWSR
jgi:hypothetical protein